MRSFTLFTSFLSLAGFISVIDAMMFCGAGQYDDGSSPDASIVHQEHTIATIKTRPARVRQLNQDIMRVAQLVDQKIWAVLVVMVQLTNPTAVQATTPPAGPVPARSAHQVPFAPASIRSLRNFALRVNWINGAIACCPCCAGTYNDIPHQTHCFSCHEHTSNPQVDYSPVGATSVDQCQSTPIAGVANYPVCKDTPGTTANPAPGTDTCPATQSGVPPSTSHVNKRSTIPKMCPQGHQQCFLYSGIGGFECVDIRNDPESCGGCVSGGDDDEGQDCTAIPGVNIVKCRQKKCAIESCRRGFQKAENGKSCKPVLRSLSMQSRYRGYGYF